MINKKDTHIPRHWRRRLSKARDLFEVADLFNEAEQYDDFDCCAELEVWCKDHPAKMSGRDKPIYIFAETESEELIYDEVAGKWIVVDKQ